MQLTNYLESENFWRKSSIGFAGTTPLSTLNKSLVLLIKKWMLSSQLLLSSWISGRHLIVFNTLRKLGFNNTVLGWVNNYLTNRKQHVFPNEIYSDYQSITQGVPQGSVLGPLFYIIYANDIAQTVKYCKIDMYADNTVLYTSHRNFDVVVKRLQNDVDSLANWCDHNGIKVNTDKTKVMKVWLGSPQSSCQQSNWFSSE